MTVTRVHVEDFHDGASTRPHRSTHTAVAIGRDEQPLARVRPVADRCQIQRLLAWAEPLGTQRTRVVESAEGLGKLLAQQLLEAGVAARWCRALAVR